MSTNNSILITGATGFLGRQCVRSFDLADWTVIPTGFSRASGSIHKLDLSSPSSFTSLLAKHTPSVVLHCAAERFPEKVDADPAAAKALNTEATRVLASECAKRGSVLIYISTDYVFSGKQGEAPYAADAETSPPNLYGETKRDGERAVLEEFKSAGKEGSAVVFRVPVLYGDAETEAESAVNTLITAVWNKAQKGPEEVAMDAWGKRYPTNTGDVARVLKDVAALWVSKTESERAELPRIVHFSAEECMTKYEICEVLADVLGLPVEHLRKQDTVDPKAAVNRPFDCHLDTSELRKLGVDVSAVRFRDWWQRYLRAYKK